MELEKMRPEARVAGSLSKMCLVGVFVISALFIGACGSKEPSSSSEPSSSTLPPGSPLATIGSGRNKPISRVGNSSTPPVKKLAPVHWRVVRMVGPREIEISSAEGYCINAEPPPKYKAVRIVERGTHIDVTAFVAKRNPSPPGEICRAVGYDQYGTIQLEQEFKDVQLYDTSTSPQGLRWPEPRR